MNESTLVKSNSWCWLPQPPVLAAWLALIALLAWSYGATFSRLIVVWWQQPDYGHGFVVPIFALALLMLRGEMLVGKSERDDWWLSRAWSGKDWLDWLPAMLRTKPALIGGAIGGILGGLLYLGSLTTEDIRLFLTRDDLSLGDANLTEQDMSGSALGLIFQHGNIIEGVCVRFFVAVGFGATLVGMILLISDIFGRRAPDQQTISDWTWWAMAAFGFTAVLRVASAATGYVFLGNYSILPCLLGLVLLVGGWNVLRWSWPSIVFLFFMIPLPTPIGSGLRGGLQSLSTYLSIRVIQTIGVPAVAMEPWAVDVPEEWKKILPCELDQVLSPADMLRFYVEHYHPKRAAQWLLDSIGV